MTRDDRVESPWVKRVALGKPCGAEKEAFQGAMEANGIVRVLRTGWNETAGWPDHGRNQDLISPNQGKQKPADHTVRLSCNGKSRIELFCRIN